MTDEYGTRHTVWRITDPETLSAVVTRRCATKLVIADGHHRYETALAYRNYCRESGRSDERAEFVMMTFVRMETDGLTILPTHRLVHSLANFDWNRFARDARAMFDWEEITMVGPPATGDRSSAPGWLKPAANGPTLGAYAGPDKLALLHLRADFDLDGALGDIAPTLRRLDVVLLHRLVIEHLLGINRQAVREERNLSYHREMESAAQLVDNGSGQVLFLLNPTPVEAVRDNALADCPMPQKSTDFYPKLLSGLSGYWLDNPAGL